MTDQNQDKHVDARQDFRDFRRQQQNQPRKWKPDYVHFVLAGILVVFAVFTYLEGNVSLFARVSALAQSSSQQYAELQKIAALFQSSKK